MDFIELAIIAMLCVLAFLLGQKFNKLKITPPSKTDKYNKIPESYEEDEENAFPLMETQENMQKNLKGHQKEVDKLMQEIQELRNKEKKHLVDIEYLKNQLEARTKQNASNVINKPKNVSEEVQQHADLINDAELNNLLHEAPKENQDISNIDKEMEEALNK